MSIANICDAALGTCKHPGCLPWVLVRWIPCIYNGPLEWKTKIYESCHGQHDHGLTNYKVVTSSSVTCVISHKANLRELAAATGLVILYKLDSNRRFFSLCDFKIWKMTLKNRAPLLYYIKLCPSSKSHRSVQTWVTVRKRSIRVKIVVFWSHMTLKFDGWPW